MNFDNTCHYRRNTFYQDKKFSINSNFNYDTQKQNYTLYINKMSYEYKS